METNDLYQAALDDYKAGWLEAADGKIREFLALQPCHFGALLFRGHLAEVLKRPQEALAIYDTAAQVSPGHGLPFTRSSIIAFRSEFGDPPLARLTEPDRAVVSLSSLGHIGRFGNQLFQYAFVRLYAREHGLVAQVPDWIGRDLFDLDDPLPAGPLPVVNETQVDMFASLNRESGQVFANCDLEGYFGGHTSRWRKPEEFQALFTPGRRIRGRLDRAMEQVFRRGRTLVAIHIRRGDFGARGFWIAPTSWYLAWLNGFWRQLDAPVLYIATDDASVVGEFSDFAPLHKAALGEIGRAHV